LTHGELQRRRIVGLAVAGPLGVQRGLRPQLELFLGDKARRRIVARGVLQRLATRIYFGDEPANEEDPILALVPAGRRATLMAVADSSHPTDWRFDIWLCGERETVFFDV